MRYLSLEALTHLATSELSRDAVKKHQETVLKALKVCGGRGVWRRGRGREGEEERGEGRVNLLFQF